MRRFFTLSLMLILLAACSPTPTAVLPSSSQNTATAVPSNPVAPSDTPIASGAVVLTSTAGSESTAGLSLQVISPVDEAVVNTPQVDVIGLASSGAVVSINDEIAIVGENGQFQVTVALDEGPNLIEVVASDDNGNESSLLLTITYEP